MAEIQPKELPEISSRHTLVQMLIDLEAIRKDESADFDILDFVTKHYNGYVDIDNTVFWFFQIWDGIPERYLYESYKGLFSSVEKGYGRYFFDKDRHEKIMSLNKHDTLQNPELLSKVDSEGYLTVYRGHFKKTKSKSSSWTLDKNVAYWFGNRNALLNGRQDFYVATGRVRLDDVIAYITSRGESEIVALQKNVKDQVRDPHERNNNT